MSWAASGREEMTRLLGKVKMHKSTLELALSRAHMAQSVEIKSRIESLGVDMHSRLAEITEQVRELHARIKTPDNTYDPRKDRLTQKLEEHLNLTKQRLQFPVAEGTKDAETISKFVSGISRISSTRHQSRRHSVDETEASLERLFAELDATPNVATTEPYLSEPSLRTRERINRFPSQPCLSGIIESRRGGTENGWDQRRGGADYSSNMINSDDPMSFQMLDTEPVTARETSNELSGPCVQLQPQPPYLTSAIRHLNEDMAQYGKFATIPTSSQGATENAFAIGAAYRETRALCTLEELNRRLTLTASHTSTDKPCSLLMMWRKFDRDWYEDLAIEEWKLSLGSSWEEIFRKREEFHDNTQQQCNLIYLDFVKPIQQRWLFDHLLWRDDVAGRIYCFVVTEIITKYSTPSTFAPPITISSLPPGFLPNKLPSASASASNHNLILREPNYKQISYRRLASHIYLYPLLPTSASALLITILIFSGSGHIITRLKPRGYIYLYALGLILPTSRLSAHIFTRSRAYRYTPSPLGYVFCTSTFHSGTVTDITYHNDAYELIRYTISLSPREYIPIKPTHYQTYQSLSSTYFGYYYISKPTATISRIFGPSESSLHVSFCCYPVAKVIHRGATL
ncbi:hypothetical protein V8F06_006591 [Rhypophila decipiens]